MKACSVRFTSTASRTSASGRLQPATEGCSRPIAVVRASSTGVCCAAVAAAHGRWSNYRSPPSSSHSGRQDSRFSNDCFQVRSSPLLTGCLRGAVSPLYRLTNMCCRPKRDIGSLEEMPLFQISATFVGLEPIMVRSPS